MITTWDPQNATDIGQNLGILLNRDFKLPDDGWYQVTNVAEVPIFRPAANDKLERIIQVLDDRAAQAMVAAFQADKAAAGENFAGLLVDYDHFSSSLDHKSEAAGWAVALENRNGELWAQIRWTDQGQADVAGGNYRFLSGTWLYSDCENLGNNRYRPLRLDRIAVTNDPRVKNMKPLSNRDGANKKEGEDTMDYKGQVITLCGLSAGANDADITNAINSAAQKLNEHGTLQARVSELEHERDELKNSNTKLMEFQVEADLKEHEAVIKNRDEVKAQLLSNREGTLKLLKALKPAVAPAPKPLHNRAEAGTPEATSAGQDIVVKQTRAVKKYQADNRCNFETAWAAVRREQPELFPTEKAE